MVVGSIVYGRVGQFKIVGLRVIDGIDHAQVKSYNPITNSVARGHGMALPLSSLRLVT